MTAGRLDVKSSEEETHKSSVRCVVVEKVSVRSKVDSCSAPNSPPSWLRLTCCTRKWKP